MATLPKSPLTPQEYLERERRAHTKSEYYRGEMFAMSGGSEAHSRLAFRLAALLEEYLRKRGCRGYTSDLRVLVESAGLYTYPDLSVVCGEAKFSDQQRDILLNPVLLIEIPSPSPENYDRGLKAKLYRAIPTLRELLLIGQDAPEIELYRRATGDTWTITDARGFDTKVELESIGYTLALAELYRDILPERAAAQ